MISSPPPLPCRNGGGTRSVGLTRPDGKEALWLPTATMAFLEEVMAARPNHHLIAADFDAFPDVQIAGSNAPLVSSTRGGRAHDFPSPYVKCGEADIFFPTDFDALAGMYDAAGQHVEISGSKGQFERRTTGKHYKSGEFLRQWADTDKTVTLSGYNPLTEDFTNTRIFLGTSRVGSLHMLATP